MLALIRQEVHVTITKGIGCLDTHPCRQKSLGRVLLFPNEAGIGEAIHIRSHD